MVGDPFEEKTFQGPQVSKTQYDKILGYVESGLSEGARLISGGKKHGDKGYFIQPTVFADVKDHMTISREEIFGPFVCISSFKTEEEVIARANDTTYGLGSALFTKDLERAHRVAAKLEAGMVWINSSGDSHFGIPFGGVKQSGKLNSFHYPPKRETMRCDAKLERNRNQKMSSKIPLNIIMHHPKPFFLRHDQAIILHHARRRFSFM